MCFFFTLTEKCETKWVWSGANTKRSIETITKWMNRSTIIFEAYGRVHAQYIKFIGSVDGFTVRSIVKYLVKRDKTINLFTFC